MGEVREVRCRGCSGLLGADLGDALLVDAMRITTPFRFDCRRCKFHGKWRPRDDPRPRAPEGRDVPREGEV